MNKLKWILQELKFAWQRAVRGYDDTIKYGYGFEYYIVRAMPGLKEFCKRALKEKSVDDKALLNKTIKLIDKYDKACNDWNISGMEKTEKEMVKYVFENVDKYWD